MKSMRVDPITYQLAIYIQDKALSPSMIILNELLLFGSNKLVKRLVVCMEYNQPCELQTLGMSPSLFSPQPVNYGKGPWVKYRRV